MPAALNPTLPRPDGTYSSGRTASRPHDPGAPSHEQLMILANRAEQGLTTAEADRLRAGLALLADQDARLTRLIEALEGSHPGGLMRRYVAAHKIRAAMGGPDRKD
ncbi:hypothetical protein [Actinacidiphila glaucinigra]|uniref:hypothetical protein n=1 Tax=Actinacidiphila glaucinigra TaxID=235986 RepID=UPI0035DB1F75